VPSYQDAGIAVRYAQDFQNTMPFFRPLLCLMLPLLSGCTAAPAYEGPPASHFDGERFVNREPVERSFADFVRLGWDSITEAVSWPEWIEIEQRKIPHARVAEGISITFINHSTFLLQVDGINILTDPVYSERVSPLRWLGPRRVHAPGVRMEDLPPIDVVLISHNHYDHLDEDTLLDLARRQEEPPLILAGLGNGALFSRLGLARHRDMDWSQSVSVGDLEIVFTECRHMSGRGIADQGKTLWGSFVIRSSAGGIYYAGDSGYGPHYRETGERFGPISLSLLPIGAYEPRWFMADGHLNPAEAVQAHLDLGSRQSVGIHFGTFQLTYEGIDQPIIDLDAALEQSGLSHERFRVLAPGETRRF
jgi:L-ascorbate metabolism protein UlaG (beta-lactamase superfamily)